MTMNATEANGNDVTWNDAAREAAFLEADRAEKAAERTFTETLPVKLSAEELADRALQAAAMRAQVAEFQSKRKALNDFWKQKIAGAESTRDELLDVIASGEEEREVECVETISYRTNTATTFRKDSGETIRERALRSSELQPSLFQTVTDAQLTLDAPSGPLAHDGDEPDDGDITDPEAVLGEDAAPAKVVRRKKTS